jgi:hypothetical protein
VRPEPSLSHRAILNPYHEPADMSAGRAFFGAGVPVEVEIGFGRPHFLRERLAQAKDRRFLGFEVRRAWCEQVMGFVDREGLDNTRIILSDARPLLLPLLTPGNVQAFYVFFPDPWWKHRTATRPPKASVIGNVSANPPEIASGVPQTGSLSGTPPRSSGSPSTSPQSCIAPW